MRGAVLAFTLPVSPAFAADCTIFETLKRQGGPEDATCSTYLAASGSTGTSCHWEYPFRGGAALQFADILWQSLAVCRPGEALGQDQLVNHPDSYDLREWSTSSGIYAISVKDKGSLNRTLVFVRFEPAR